MRRHTTLRVEEQKSYANQGITAEATVLARAPAAQETKETWFAVGREIARLRFYFDGAAGGQETTFGQNEANGAAANASARGDDALHPLLSLARDYRTMRVVDRSTVGGEAGYVLELTPAAGDPVYLTLSQASGLPLERRDPTTAERFGDYRRVDGERLPFRVTVRDPLGETNVRVRSAAFGAAIPAGAFAKSRRPLSLRAAAP